jgi:hypothetical protein
MTSYPCSSCGLRNCSGECYFAELEPAENPPCYGCKRPIDDEGLCAVCDAQLIARIERDLRFTMELQRKDAA